MNKSAFKELAFDFRKKRREEKKMEWHTCRWNTGEIHIDRFVKANGGHERLIGIELFMAPLKDALLILQSSPTTVVTSQIFSVQRLFRIPLTSWGYLHFNLWICSLKSTEWTCHIKPQLAHSQEQLRLHWLTCSVGCNLRTHCFCSSREQLFSYVFKKKQSVTFTMLLSFFCCH